MMHIWHLCVSWNNSRQIWQKTWLSNNKPSWRRVLGICAAVQSVNSAQAENSWSKQTCSAAGKTWKTKHVTSIYCRFEAIPLWPKRTLAGCVLHLYSLDSRHLVTGHSLFSFRCADTTNSLLAFSGYILTVMHVCFVGWLIYWVLVCLCICSEVNTVTSVCTIWLFLSLT